MAKLKATPKNFAQASAYLGGRDSVRLGNNTYLEKHLCGIVVRLHSTNIVCFHEDGRTVLFSGGYRTVTTKERINHFITGRLYQEAHKWFVVVKQNGVYVWDSPLDYTEGFTFYNTEAVQ
jgi:hypothetical protein